MFKTAKKGWGVKTRSPIPSGRFLGVYSGEMITEAECEARGALYDKVGRTYLFDLDGFHIATPPKGLEYIDPRAYELAEAARQRAEAAKANDGSEDYCYSAYSGEYLLSIRLITVDAFHLGVSSGGNRFRNDADCILFCPVCS